MSQAVDVGAQGLSTHDFKRPAEFVQGHVGIRIKKTMLGGRLRRRVRALGLRRFFSGHRVGADSS